MRKLGDGLEVFAVSEDGIIEGFYKKEYPFFFCVQWHPERKLKSTGEKNELELKKYDTLSLWLFETFIREGQKSRVKS